MLKLYYKHSMDLGQQQNFQLDDNSVFWIGDTINYDHLDRVLEKAGRPKYLVNDNCFAHQRGDIYTVPFWLAQNIESFRGLDFSENTQCDHCFNFIVNKRYPNRNLLLKLVEYFDLTTQHYTWSGTSKAFDFSEIIDEINLLKSQGPLFQLESRDSDVFVDTLLSPCNIPQKILQTPGLGINQVALTNWGQPIDPWNQGIKALFEKTAVSLISESVRQEHMSCVTEKSAYAVFGLTFPVWVGGYGIPAAWQQAGLDIFDDVIDHSYQYYPTLLERCYYAFKNNLKILQDLDHAQTLRDRCRARLLQNRQKLLDGALSDYCRKTVDTWPSDLKLIVKPFAKKVFAIEL